MDFGGNQGYMSHMGEGNWRMARTNEPVDLLVNPFKLVPLKQFPISLRFALRPGPVTLLSLTCGENGKVRFIITEGSIADQPALSSIIRTHSFYKPNKPLIHFLNDYAQAGGSHHMGMVYGSATSRLVKLACLMKIDYEII
jgi:L-arabinose isomerase